MKIQGIQDSLSVNIQKQEKDFLKDYSVKYYIR